jgi:endonuclease YncB( thermonuclease family)
LAGRLAQSSLGIARGPAAPLKAGFRHVTRRYEPAIKGKKSSGRWIALAALLALTGFAGMWVFMSSPKNQQLPRVSPPGGSAMMPSRILVLDGDTIRIDNSKPDVRLVGFNAPETRRPQCSAERDLGEAATRRLRQLVNGGSLNFK